MRAWWLKLYIPVQHRIHCWRHRQQHVERCTCHGTGKLP